MTVRCGVLGDPVAHSLSPVLHRAGYTALGLHEWAYDAHQVPSGSLADFLAGLDESWRGLSLTMPLKREVVGLLDSATADVLRAGAANTVVMESGARHGHNTDIPGAAAAIRERCDGPLGTAVVLGGGATATSVGLSLADLGVGRVVLAVRDSSRAVETTDALRAVGLDVTVDVLEGGSGWDADLVVSTIPAAAQAPGLVARCDAVRVVFEVVYDPWPTPLAASALADSDRVLVSGLDLLVHQAALQFELFTGRSAPLGAMRAAGERALAVRVRP